jgi:hypothetical protein
MAHWAKVEDSFRGFLEIDYVEMYLLLVSLVHVVYPMPILK